MSLSGKIESLLYISGDDGIEIKELKRVLEISSDEIKAELKSLGKKYEGDADSCFIIKNYDDK
jgi:chromosome segregation and condensation protein ScpB